MGKNVKKQQNFWEISSILLPLCKSRMKKEEAEKQEEEMEREEERKKEKKRISTNHLW